MSKARTKTNPAKRTPNLANIVDSGSSLASRYTLRRVILYVTPFSLTAPSLSLVDVYLLGSNKVARA